MPEWAKFEKEAKSMGVTTKKVEAHEDPETIEKLGIKGFPTIMIEKGGKTVEYSGARTAAALKETVSA
jgi:protein-disulfide isomerase-like protein with CxxC motif